MSRPLKTSYKVALSAFIVFHLFCVFVLPNPDSILYRETASIVTAYGNTFGFNTTWRFFSPNPQIRRLEYEVFSRDADGQLKGEVFRYPLSLEREGSREHFNRKMNNAMFMMGRMEFMEGILGPRICAWHPEAESIGISMVGRSFPTIEKSRFQGDSRERLSAIERQYLMDVHCHREDAP